MKIKDFVRLFEIGKRRYHLIGNGHAGVLVGLDLEGRLYAIFRDKVLNRVNPDAILGQSTAEKYLNPGGDGLWPAPEGTCLGYQYATGKWRVPPGLSGARYWIVRSSSNQAVIRAEIDLINSKGRGIPVAFERHIAVRPRQNGMFVKVGECIEYMGVKPLTSSELLIAPWTLAQFDSGPGCEVVFPATSAADVWDLYAPSDSERRNDGKLWHARTEGKCRYQIGIGKNVDWIEYRDPRRGLNVRRRANAPLRGQAYIDIADRPPVRPPLKRGVRYSVYSDQNGFMEIEAAGGCPKVVLPGARLSLTVSTVFSKK